VLGGEGADVVVVVVSEVFDGAAGGLGFGAAGPLGGAGGVGTPGIVSAAAAGVGAAAPAGCPSAATEPEETPGEPARCGRIRTAASSGTRPAAGAGSRVPPAANAAAASDGESGCDRWSATFATTRVIASACRATSRTAR
jgi:hypothetical protein